MTPYQQISHLNDEISRLNEVIIRLKDRNIEAIKVGQATARAQEREAYSKEISILNKEITDLRAELDTTKKELELKTRELADLQGARNPAIRAYKDTMRRSLPPEYLKKATSSVPDNYYSPEIENKPFILDLDKFIKKIASQYLLKNAQAAVFNKTRLREFLQDPEIHTKIIKFIRAVNGYQSNSEGDYYKEVLAETYNHIPEDFKKYLAVPKSKLKQLHRGADGKSPKAAISWTKAEHLARFFGRYHYRYSALQSHGGTIDTAKLVKICDNIKELYNYQIGDDEDEVIILHPVWKTQDPEVLE